MLTIGITVRSCVTELALRHNILDTSLTSTKRNVVFIIFNTASQIGTHMPGRTQTGCNDIGRGCLHRSIVIFNKFQGLFAIITAKID